VQNFWFAFTLRRDRSRGRFWAAIRLPHHPEPSGHAPWRGRWIWQWRTTWSTVCSSAPHSQVSERAIPHLCKQVRKRPTLLRSRLSRTHVFLAEPFWENGCRCQGWKYVFSCCSPTTPPYIGDSVRARYLCCCYRCQMNWWVVVRRVQMGVSIWDAVHSHLVDRWTLWFADC